MKVNNVAIGIALVLSVVSFVLALWPAVGDAPWEESSVTVVRDETPQQQRRSQAEICLKLINTVTITETAYPSISARGKAWAGADCEEYFANVSK